MGIICADPLSASERKEWASLREEVSVHQDAACSFIEALTEIRDKRLYREEYKTFEAYVNRELSLSKTHVNRMIQQHEVEQDLTPTGVKLPERHARELVKAPKEKRQEAANKAQKKAAAEGRKPKANDYKKAVKELEYEDIADDDDELEMPVQMKEAELAVANGSGIGKSIVKHLNAAITVIKGLEDVPGNELLIAREKSILRELDNVKQAVNVTIPHSVCPRCGGAGCAQCGNMGWVNSVMARELNV